MLGASPPDAGEPRPEELRPNRSSTPLAEELFRCVIVREGLEISSSGVTGVLSRDLFFYYGFRPYLHVPVHGTASLLPPLRLDRQSTGCSPSRFSPSHRWSATGWLDRRVQQSD